MNYLDILTEWVRNKPEDAALRIIELENLLGGDGCEPLPVTPNQPWTPPKEPAEALPGLPDWDGVFAPAGSPQYSMEDGVSEPLMKRGSRLCREFVRSEEVENNS